MLRSVSPTPPGTSVIASSTCSVDRYSSFRLARSPSAFSSTRYVDAPSCASRTVAPLTRGNLSSSSSTRRRAAVTSTPMRSSTPETTPSGWSSSARNRCSGAISVFPASRASACAAANASWVLRVKRFGSIGMGLPQRLHTGERARADRNELASILTMRVADARFHLVLHLVEARFQLLDTRVCDVQFLLERKDALHPGQGDSIVG